MAAQDGFFTIGPNTTDLKFVADAGSPGVPPSGYPVGGTNGVDSGLKTTDGTSIYLFQSSATNNVIYGAIGNNAANPAAFVIALDEQFSGTNVTNAKMWIIQYATIQHNGQNLTEDDTVNLLNKVFVASTSFTQSIFSDFSDPGGLADLRHDRRRHQRQPGRLPRHRLSRGRLAPHQLNVGNQGSFPEASPPAPRTSVPVRAGFDLVTTASTPTPRRKARPTPSSTSTPTRRGPGGVFHRQNQGARPTDLKIEILTRFSNTADGHTSSPAS